MMDTQLRTNESDFAWISFTSDVCLGEYKSSGPSSLRLDRLTFQSTRQAQHHHQHHEALVLALLAFALDAVSGASTPGVAAGVTGGGNAAPVYPKNTNELKAYLQDAVPRVIVLNKTFDFRGTEGTTSETECRPDYTRECIAKKKGFKSQDVILEAAAPTARPFKSCTTWPNDVHVTNLNPQYVWGGDAIYLNGKPDGSAKDLDRPR
ncbi:hypothetical protein SPRG_18383 [Saprolegnia parasitica CBS 223.65]|uniref:Uncharacterized protein n=1 Tax=Saprolegnia parasitica (strain CBS 223.65) TaxID=695850 RepID=A0A067BH51_SAPPC|nr:hypothetical protein SPRG_18383 [Saprolegnia parasitica CBS 223.65]KDO16080.1 hypothetical protein SPRG_18383 [Saprolegnia parasitica CBS 223.65]|eukprot:XP_012213210.1 hypothetical protein SPRG_18383 [Saprolegnia parasitica CBS 223.65]